MDEYNYYGPDETYTEELFRFYRDDHRKESNYVHLPYLEIKSSNTDWLDRDNLNDLCAYCFLSLHMVHVECFEQYFSINHAKEALRKGTVYVGYVEPFVSVIWCNEKITMYVDFDCENRISRSRIEQTMYEDGEMNLIKLYCLENKVFRSISFPTISEVRRKIREVSEARRFNF